MRPTFIIILIIFLVKIILSSVSSAGPIIDSGNDALKKGDYQTAIAMYSVNIDLKPDDPEGYIRRGVVFVTMGQYDFAIMDFNKAISLDQNNSVAYNNLAVALIGLGKYQQAYSNANQAVLFNPRNAESHYTRAVAGYFSNNKDLIWFDLLESQRLGFAPATKMFDLYNNERR